ncbi:GT-D fold domain-containing glycosyltransferase [Glutamicibacter arilaitensis]|uniref:GT-D fold domain-containing glycosyltransferase n=1 Tax=Glutamicibacter arilaitensis TaxID=256701 RepID=UPI003F8E837E
MLSNIKRFANRNFNVQVANKKPIPVKMTGNDELPALLKQVIAELKRNRKELSAIRTATSGRYMDEVAEVYAHQVLPFKESLEMLAESDASLARFGDGEFRLMLRSEFNLNFQINSKELQYQLRDVFETQSSDLLIGFPFLFRDAHWSNVYAELWPSLKPLISPQQRFINAHITRPRAFETLGQQAVDLWRNVWDQKDAVIVTGEGSRFDLIPELFDNLGRVDFVHSTPMNAFADLERVVAETQKKNPDLVIISLGPAGTILAKLLSEQGIRALDIGHLSSSYLNVMQGHARPERTPALRQAQ